LQVTIQASSPSLMPANLIHLDWDDSTTDLAHLKGAAPGVAKSAGDKLWEDNWDDDDIEDEFSVQLRYDVSTCLDAVCAQVATC
jgi:hypothetical protein